MDEQQGRAGEVVDALVLAVDGTTSTWSRGPGEDPRELVGRATGVPRRAIGSQGMGRLRAWYIDDATGQHRNPVADRVLQAVGYHHPYGWAGPVALTMEADREGDVPAMAPAVLAALREVAAPSPQAG